MKTTQKRIDELPDGLAKKLVDLQYELIDAKLNFCWHCSPNKQAVAVFAKAGAASHLALFHAKAEVVVFPLQLAPPEITVGKGFLGTYLEIKGLNSLGEIPQPAQRYVYLSSDLDGRLPDLTDLLKSVAPLNNKLSGKAANEKPFDLREVPEEQLIAFYGALFAMAAADSRVDRDEVSVIFGALSLDNLSPEAKETVYSYITSPPPFDTSVRKLVSAAPELKYALMFYLVETGWADGLLTDDERQAIVSAQVILQISDDKLAAIENFVAKARDVANRGLDDSAAADSLKQASSTLAAVGVPIGAVYLSGSVIGLSAAGITSGLAALGLGFGMVPGIGVAIMLGTAIYIGASHLLDTGGKQKKARTDAERERKAQSVIKNLQACLNHLIEQVNKLSLAAADAEANREAIKELTERMFALKQALAKRSGTA